MEFQTHLNCGYRNCTDRMVIARCCGPAQFYLERVVFPFELLSFECPPQSQVEIWTYGLGGAELVETLRSEELIIEEPLALAASQPEPLVNALDPSPWLIQG